MKPQATLAAALALTLCLTGCGYHWARGRMDVQLRLQPPPVVDLRTALEACATRHAPDQVAALRLARDGELPTTLAPPPGREFNVCMTENGFIAMPDHIFAP